MKPQESHKDLHKTDTKYVIPKLGKRATRRKKIVDFLQKCDDPVSPQEVADGTGLKVGNATSGLIEMAEDGILIKHDYGAYQLPLVGDTPTVNTPRENSPNNVSENTYDSAIQVGITTTAKKPLTTEAPQDANSPHKQEGELEVDPDVGYSQVFIPEWIEVYMFDQLVARVHMSQIVPGKRHTVQLAEKVLTASGGSSEKGTPPQKNNESSPE